MWLSLRTNVVLAALLAALLSSLSARADEAEDQYAVAAGHYAHQRWKFAAEEFQAFVRKYPNHPKASQGVFFLAEALTQLGQMDEAAARFRDYLSREPQGRFAAPALFRAGEVAYLVGKLDQAKPELERFLKTHADDQLNAYVLPYLGDIALSQDDAPSAESYFRRGLSRFPQGKMQDECRYGLARALEKQGKSEEAERFYLAVAGKTGSPLADDAQFRLGALYYASGRFQEAVDTLGAFESTLAKSPWQATARLGRGWALFKLNKLAEARSTFQAVTSDAELGVEAQYWLGLTQKAQKEWPAATQTFLDAAAAHPHHKLTSALRFQAGDCLLSAGQAAAADQQFDLAVAASPSDGQWLDDAMRGKVQAALVAKDFDSLDRRVAQFNARCPGSPLAADVQRMSARSLLERKEYARAAAVLEPLVRAGQAESAVSTLPEDRYLLSLAYEGLGRHQEALDVLLPALGSATGDLQADARTAQASLLMQLQRFDEAVGPLEALLTASPAGERASRCLGNLAICYAETGKLDKAKSRYAELVQKHPGDELIGPTTEQVAEAAYDAGDVAWADQLFASLANKGQSTRDRNQGLSGLAWSQYKSGRLKEAADTFDRLLKADPDPPLAADAALTRGRILQQLGESDPALAMYDLVIDRYRQADQFPEALWAAALLRDTLEQDQEAASLYEQLATGFPKFPQIDAVLYNWAWTQEDLGREKESSELFDRLRKEHPESAYWADAAFRLAQRAFEAKDYPRARQLAADILAAKPSGQMRENTLYLQGQIAAAEERWPDARLAFETLVRDYPESSLRLLAEYGVAESIFRQDDYQGAGERLRELVRRTEGRDEPWLAVVHLRLAQALVHQKKWDEAYEIAAAIESRYPGFAEQYEVDYVLGRCLSTRAEFEQAREAYRKVIRSAQGAKTETAAKAQLMIAESYYHQKNYEQALREYLALEILYAYPTWQAAAVLEAAKCHEMLGEWQQAVEEYGRLLAEYAETSYTEEARERLQAAKQHVAAASAR
jgi:TolA-binding protein